MGPVRIAVVAQKGGVAKTTVSLALAWELQERGWRVLVVDTDAPQFNAYKRMQTAYKRTKAKPPSVIIQGADLHRPENLPSLETNYDFVVIDTPPRVADDVIDTVLLLAHVALVPIGHNQSEAEAVQETVDSIVAVQKRLNPDLKAAFVYTRVKSKTAAAKHWRRLLQASALPLLAAECTDRIAWSESNSAGVGVAQYAPNDLAATESRTLTDAVLQLAGVENAPRVAVGFESNSIALSGAVGVARG